MSECGAGSFALSRALYRNRNSWLRCWVKHSLTAVDYLDWGEVEGFSGLFSSIALNETLFMQQVGRKLNLTCVPRCFAVIYCDVLKYRHSAFLCSPSPCGAALTSRRHSWKMASAAYTPWYLVSLSLRWVVHSLWGPRPGCCPAFWPKRVWSQGGSSRWTVIYSVFVCSQYMVRRWNFWALLDCYITDAVLFFSFFSSLFLGGGPPTMAGIYALIDFNGGWGAWGDWDHPGPADPLPIAPKPFCLSP